MSELITKPSVDQIKGIQSPEIILICKTIKQMQKRLKDDDIVGLEYIRVYDKMSKEFEFIFNRHTEIFTKVIRGIDLEILASILYYKDQINRGLLTEKELSDMLAKKYLPEHLKMDADRKMAEMNL